MVKTASIEFTRDILVLCLVDRYDFGRLLIVPVVRIGNESLSTGGYRLDS